MNAKQLEVHRLVRNEMLVLDPKTRVPDGLSSFEQNVMDDMARAIGHEILVALGAMHCITIQPGTTQDTKYTMRVVVSSIEGHTEFMGGLSRRMESERRRGWDAGHSQGINEGKRQAIERLSAIIEAEGDA